MAIDRRVLGPNKQRFSVTKRATPGTEQIVAPVTPTPQRPTVAPTAAPVTGGYVPMYQPAAPTFENRYGSGAVSGYQELAEQSWLQKVGQGISDWWNADEPSYIGASLLPDYDTSINPSGPSTPPPGYLTPGDKIRQEAASINADPTRQNVIGGGLFPEGPGIVADRERAEEEADRGTNDGNVPWNEKRTKGITDNDISADRRLKDRVAAQGVQSHTPTKEEIVGWTNSAVDDFNVERARLEALRQGALADGLQAEADRYDDQIHQIEKSIMKLEDEIALTGDIETWYRTRIAEPYQKAREAADAVNLEATMAVQQKYRDEQAVSLAETEERLEGVLADLGFSPEGIEAMRGERAADNEVTAAQMELLEASGVRRGELDWEKKLKLSMVEEEWMRSGRESTGREMVVSARNREAIADAKDRIGELTDLKSKAMDRVRRAVDREFQGAEFPEKEEFVGAAMDAMMQDLIGDLSPNEQAWFQQAFAPFIADGKAFNMEAFRQYVLANQIYVPVVSEDLDKIEKKWKAIAQENDVPFEALADQVYAEMYAATADMLDMEDQGILTGMISTHSTALEEYDRYIEQRQDRNYSGGDNRNPQNIADAQSGVGIYGERVRFTAQMVPVIEQMWGDMLTDIQGANYFRPVPDTKVAGQAMNSDHLTAGALDLMMPRGSAEHRRFYEEVMVPKLRQWQAQGIIASWVGYEQNSAHDDHVHISFALGANNDQAFNPQQPHQHNDETNAEHQRHVDQGTTGDFRGGM